MELEWVDVSQPPQNVQEVRVLIKERRSSLQGRGCWPPQAGTIAAGNVTAAGTHDSEVLLSRGFPLSQLAQSCFWKNQCQAPAPAAQPPVTGREGCRGGAQDCQRAGDSAPDLSCPCDASTGQAH